MTLLQSATRRGVSLYVVRQQSTLSQRQVPLFSLFMPRRSTRLPQRNPGVFLPRPHHWILRSLSSSSSSSSPLKDETISERVLEDMNKKYELWKAGKGPPPRDLLLDSNAREVVSPRIHPDFEIQADTTIWPPELQRAVQEHVYWACLRTVPIFNRGKERNIVKHCKLDSRKSLKQARKKQIRKELVVTPFVMIGAYQRLLHRAQQYPYGCDGDDQIGDNIRNASIPFAWFSLAAKKLQNMHGQICLPARSEALCDVHIMIVHETMAMVMRPIVAQFLPAHSWYRCNMRVTRSDTVGADYKEDDTEGDYNDDDQVGDQNDDWKYIPGTARVEELARNRVNYDTSGHELLIWDMAADRKLGINPIQMKGIVNVIEPYVSSWWTSQVIRMFNQYGIGPIKRKKVWHVTDDKYSSLPSLLVDLLFLRFDYDENLKKNPLYYTISQAQKSDRKKQKIGVFKILNLPKGLQDSAMHVNFHRWGPTICFTYVGPEKLKTKLCRAVELTLKSTLHFDKKLVDGVGFREVQPRRKLTAPEIEQMALATAKV